MRLVAARNDLLTSMADVENRNNATFLHEH